ncbi:MAG: hypothetical protein ACTS8R_07550 [Arsenophonus sp. NC-QC1-MAG3]
MLAYKMDRVAFSTFLDPKNQAFLEIRKDKTNSFTAGVLSLY